MTSGLLNANEQTSLLTAQTRASNPISGAEVPVRIIFDSGSHRSYITTSCARDLNLREVRTDSLRVAVFGTTRSLTVVSQQVEVKVTERGGSKRSIQLHTTPIITHCPIAPATISTADLAAVHAMRYELADHLRSVDTIDILIGSDYFWDFITGAKTTTPSGLYLIPSTLGYLVGGRYEDEDTNDGDSEKATLLCITETFSQVPHESGLMATKSRATPESPDIEEFWCLEKIGITDDPVTNDDDEALAQFNDTVQFGDGRYHLRWPWKKNADELRDNFELSLGRFNGLARRLKTTHSGILSKYNEVIQDQLKKGVIEPVLEKFGDFRDCPNVVHYLPHHPVVKPSSTTTKIRIVYDASAKPKRQVPSLNECLHRGPVLLPDLCQTLMRFRLHTIGIVADVEKAFLQMSLQPCDRDVTRFIWFKDPDIPQVENNLMTYRFCRVPFGIISSPFLLGATIQYHLKQMSTPIAREIARNVYVDNIIPGVENINDAVDFYNEAKQIFQTAGMNLQEWASNNDKLLEHIPQRDAVKGTLVKVLGMLWDCNDDTLSLKRVSELVATTKREVLQSVASVYDPLGIFQPVLLASKVFLRELWDDCKGWDEALDSEARGRWEQIRSEVLPLFEIRISRAPFAPFPPVEMSVVAFSDASLKAYAAAIYLRCRPPNAKEWVTNLVYSKTRLTPRKASKKDVTLPRLELLGLLIGARAARFVHDAVSVHKPVPIYAFTDSMCVLHWTKSTKPLSIFVENRIREISERNMSEIKYVNTIDDPADISTRGVSAEKIANHQLWWHGPCWLKYDRNEWPKVNIQNIDNDRPELIDAVASEIRKTAPVTVLVAGEDPDVEVSVMGIKGSRYSSVSKLMRITALCLKFIGRKLWKPLSAPTRSNLPVCFGNIFDGMSLEPAISAHDLNVARGLWIRAAQRHHFADAITAIQRGRPHNLRSQLGVEFDKLGFLRCHGRLDHAVLSYDAVEPTILHAKCFLTDLIIRDVHERLLHAGVGHTLSQVRQTFWVPRGRSVVKKVLNRCILCKKNTGPPFALPDMPPWPKERVSRSAPFKYIGLDYLGPLNVRVGDKSQKMWICLFTCLAIRAVHLELVPDCTTIEFLQAVIRFVSRRGVPHEIISDNAPQFRTTKTAFDKIWAQVMTDETVQSYLAKEQIRWTFTAELAPWQGGVYERLVGIVKRCLRFGIGRKLLPWEQLVTLIAEVESIVNSRPITYVYGDFASVSTLRPVDFLTELSTGLPSTDNSLRADGMGDAGRDLIRYWKYKQGRLDQLWSFWYDEYILSLRERSRKSHRNIRGAIRSFPVVDEVVIIKNTDLPRGAWKLARVTNVIISKDGKVRSCELKLPNGFTIRRPVNHLFPLEIDGCDSVDNDNDGEFEGFTEHEVNEANNRVNNLARRNINNSLSINAMNISFCNL